MNYWYRIPDPDPTLHVTPDTTLKLGKRKIYEFLSIPISIRQCCGSGSGIRAPGSGAFLTPGSVSFTYVLLALFRIRDVLVRIRIPDRLTGFASVFGAGSCAFIQWISRCQQKINFLTLICLLLSLGTLTSVLKDYKS
jgi:hypothetical protein